MLKKSIQEILPFLENPSRYLGTEVNRIKKDPSRVKLKIALAFPDLYEIGMSHFGIQILYHVLNQAEDIAAERVFAPATDMAQLLKAENRKLTSLESDLPLKTFDIVGFSLLYELNYTNILGILDLSNIPFYAGERGRDDPFIIAGGPCTCNPEPVAPFFDAMVVGDGERVILDMARAWIQWKDDGETDRVSLLKRWSSLQGVYIPGFFKEEIDPDGFQKLVPIYDTYKNVRRAVISDLDGASFPESPIVPYGRPVHDRLRLEVSRGCSRGCRYCQAGMIYRPVRERSLENLLGITERSLCTTGYEDLSLLSLSTGDYSNIDILLGRIMQRHTRDCIAVSLPSLRADTLTPEMMAHIKKVRKTGFTIAPEAGSQRLRNVINKNISEEEIRDTVRGAFELGWQVIKLYFMIGLPTETQKDLEALVELVKRLHAIKGPNGRKGKINVSVTTFIPKAHTPFQWEAQMGLEESKRKIQWIKGELNRPGIQVKWQNPEVSLMEGLWARGDRRLHGLLVNAYAMGCRFDGWSDQFNFKIWMDAVEKSGVDMDFFTIRQRALKEPLPWDIIDTGVRKSFLAAELEKAKKGQSTLDCRNGECQDCGVCDFKVLAPKQAQTTDSADKTPVPGEERPDKRIEPVVKVKLCFSKRGPARFFGHLEMVNIFMRAVRRARIPVQFSQGFHPKPLVSFEDALPIGMESLCESMFMTVSNAIRINEIQTALNGELPEGLRIEACGPASGTKRKSNDKTVIYEIIPLGWKPGKSTIDTFLKSETFVIERTYHKRPKKKIDLKNYIKEIKLTEKENLLLTLISSGGKSIRPAEVIQAIFRVEDKAVKQSTITKVSQEWT